MFQTNYRTKLIIFLNIYLAFAKIANKSGFECNLIKTLLRCINFASWQICNTYQKPRNLGQSPTRVCL